MRPLGCAPSLMRLQAQLPPGCARSVFERALEPGGEHVANAASATAPRGVDARRIVDPHARESGGKIDLERLELAPPALRQAAHVMMKDVEPGQPMMRGFLPAPVIGRSVSG